MKLRRIEISGFKSFIDRTVLLVDDQLTAVVGPNGCGKSNIVDAIRWAMGEQSAKALRGKAMDEVIFSGSESRPHANSAEVVLTFENSSGTGHPNYAAIAEIAQGRRITREGGSEYSINGSPCRRRDVTELLLAAGVSPRSSMVEQGRMGLIVTARPEERRLLKVADQRLFESPADFAALIPADLAEPFTTADLASAIDRPTGLAQRMAYCLREMGAIAHVGKSGKAFLYNVVRERVT